MGNVFCNMRQSAALATAELLAGILKSRYGATHVHLFGSVLTDDFTEWSDIDIAVKGVSPVDFYPAVSACSDNSGDFEVDLVDLDDCPADLRQGILSHGSII